MSCDSLHALERNAEVSISTVHALDVDGFGRLAASGTTPDKFAKARVTLPLGTADL